MFRIYRAAARHLDPELLFRALAAELRSVTGSPAILLAHGDPGAGSLHWFNFDVEGQSCPYSPLVRWRHSPFGQVWELQRPLILDLTSSDREPDGALSFLAEFGAVEACLLPASIASRRVGVVAVCSRKAHSFSDSAVRLLLPLAGQVAQAMDHAFHSRKLAHLESETTRLNFLLELNSAVMTQSNPAALMGDISTRIRQLAQVDAVALILPDTSGHSLKLSALDFSEQLRQPVRYPQTLPCDSIAGTVFRSGKPWSGNPQKLSEGCADTFARESGLRSICAFPLAKDNRVLGVLGVGRFVEGPFSSEDTAFLTKIAQQMAVAISNFTAIGNTRELGSGELKRSSLSGASTPGALDFGDIVGSSSALRSVLEQLRAVAPAQTTVLISGETGTGKELLAQAIHRLSRNSRGAFVKVNCAALPPGLLESELFGHERGAFTGALAQRIGRFELANHGTLFLDEISELPLELQSKLLRVLQEREFERLGSSRTLRTNARLIAATNRDLSAMVAEGRFRADLFYRLNVFPLRLPPLRQRPEDIPVLAHHFVRHFANSLNRTIHSISAETMQAFVRHDWPGNIRELQNVIERAVILSRSAILDVSHLGLFSDNSGTRYPSRQEVVDEAERRHLLSVLRQANWVIAGPDGAAVRLGMKRSTLQFRLKKLGISRPVQM